MRLKTTNRPLDDLKLMVLKEISRSCQARGYAPTIRELSVMFKYSTNSSVQRAIQQLYDDGLLVSGEKHSNGTRSPRALTITEAGRKIILGGQNAAG